MIGDTDAHRKINHEDYYGGCTPENCTVARHKAGIILADEENPFRDLILPETPAEPKYPIKRDGPPKYDRRKRGIAGSMIFMVFDREAMLEALSKEDRDVYKKNLEKRMGEAVLQDDGEEDRHQGVDDEGDAEVSDLESS